MRTTGFGAAAVAVCFIAAAAAISAVAITQAQAHTSKAGFRWIDCTLAATGAVSAACAIAVSCFQACRCFTGTRSKAGVVLAAVGAAAHTAMLVSLTAFWLFFATRSYYSSRNSGAKGPARHTIVQRRVNYFEYYHRWSDEETALFFFGCVNGTIAWLLALLLAVCDYADASRQDAQDAVSQLESNIPRPRRMNEQAAGDNISLPIRKLMLAARHEQRGADLTAPLLARS